MDVVFPLKVKYYQKFGRTTPDETERFYLFKRHPILCGILAFRATLELQHIGINLCNAWGTITYPVQFYNALRHKESPVKRWPKLERAIALHTKERLFIGAAPKTIQESFKQVCLILGYSAASFAPNRWRKAPEPSKNGPRGLKDTTILGDFFQADLSGQDGSVFSLRNVEALLNDEAKSSELASDPRNKALRREWATTKRLTPLQLLQALRLFIPIEIPKINFNYLRMHEQSIRLLRQLRQTLDADLIKYFGPRYLENEFVC